VTALPAARGDAGADVAATVRDRLRDVVDFPAAGVVFKDISALLADGAAMGACTGALASRAAAAGAELIAGIEARGFLVAAALGSSMGLGVIPIRKAGKLPPPTRRLRYALEYGTAEIEVPELGLAGRRVYLVDDVLATGGTVEAAHQLLEMVGAEVVGVGMLIELEFLAGRARLGGQDVHSLLRL
jgi:adenine phosphoribosyltransferase